MELAVREGVPEHGEPWYRVSRENDTGRAPSHPDPLHAQLAPQQLEPDRSEQPCRRFREGAEPVAQLAPKILRLLQLFEPRNAAVQVHLLLGVQDVLVRKVRLTLHRHLGCHRFLPDAAVPQPAHRSLEQPLIHIQPHGLRETGLIRSQQVARAAKLKIPQSHLVAGPELRVVFQYPEPALRLRSDVRRNDEVTVRPVVRAADTAAELVELSEAEAVAPVDDHRVCTRHVETVLDDRCADQHAELAIHQRDHRGLQIPLGHLPVRHGHLCLRYESAHPLGHGIDRLHPVVNEEDLTAPIQLSPHRILDDPIVPGEDVGDDRHPVTRRRLDQGKIPESPERHLQGPGDRRGGESEHVERALELLEALLVAHAEPLLLIHDEEAEVAEAHVRRQQPVRSDDDVDAPVREALQRHPLLGPGAEA